MSTRSWETKDADLSRTSGEDSDLRNRETLKDRARAWAIFGSWFRLVAAAAGLALIAIGSIVTIGWIVRAEALIQLLPNMLPMTRNTAACFLLSGFALLVLALNGPRWVVVASAALIGLVGVLTLIHHLFGIATGIADILGPPYVPATSTGAGMALISSIAFTVGAIGLLAALRTTPGARMLLGTAGSIVGACAIAGLTAAGILSGARGLAPHSVVGFLIFGFGLLALGWQSDPHYEGTPRWLPVAVAIGILSGILGLWRTLVAGGHEPFAMTSLVVVTAGIILSVTFALTVYLAQLGFAQAAALATSERETREILDSVPTLVSLLAPNGDVQLVSRRTIEYTGKTQEELEAWGMSDLIHADDRADTIKRFRAGLESGARHEIVFRMRRHDGVYRWFEAVQTPLNDESGRLVRWCVAVNDIDDRKRLEDSLRESARSSASVIDGIPGLVARLDPDGGVAFVNRRILEFTGVPIEELRNWGSNGIVHPDDMAHVADVFTTSIAAGKPYLIEQRLRRHDGVYRWFDNRGLPIRDESGTVTGWYVLMANIDDRKRAEDALAASERKLQLTIDTMPAMAWSTTPDGMADFFNKNYLDFVGLPPDKLQGTAWGSTVHPEDVPALMKAWQGMVGSGQGGHAEARVRRHDGQYRWFLQRANPLRDDTGKIVRWYGVNTDIEDSKRADASLAREKQILEKIASGSVPLREVLTELCRFVEEDAIDLLCDVHPIDWSTGTFRFGTSPTLPADYTVPITGLPVKDELLPCAMAANSKAQIIAEDLETDPRWQSSHVRDHALKFGLRSVWSTPILSTAGTVLGTFCIYQRQPAKPSEQHQSLIAHATHIASIAIERLQTEEELRRSYDRLAAAQKLSKTGNFTADVVIDNHIWSAELYRIFELDPGTKISVQHVRGVIHPDDLPAFDADFQKSATEGKPFDQVFRIITKGGKLKYLHALAEVAEMTQNRPVFSGAIRDVTDEKVAEQALNATRSELAHVARVTALSTLSASIAHEVNQPLSGIITNASTSLRMLAADPPNIEGARETARRTIRDGNRASEVITRLRALFSRKPATLDSVDLNEATREIVALVSSDLHRNQVTLQLALDPIPPVVVGDRVQLQQVILNLVRNASDAMRTVSDRPRTLLIRTEVDDEGSARVVVSDAGVGLGAETVARLFDAFYTTKCDGMGIGLSVSRSIIESHGGKLWAESNDGPGATFAFSIPRRSGEARDGRRVENLPHPAASPDVARNS